MRQKDVIRLFNIIFITYIIIYFLRQLYKLEGFRREKRAKGFIIRLGGGFGNQIFIYAGALALKHAFNVPVFLAAPENSGENGNVHSKTDYRFLFKGCTPIEDDDERIKQAKHFKFNEAMSYKYYDNNEIPIEEDSYIYFSYHWFQNYEYVKDVIPEVRESILPEFARLYPNLKIDNNSSAFIHVRRGDYLTSGFGYRMIPSKYYQKGLDILNNNNTIQTIYIISDDIAWCKKEKWNSTKKIVFYDEPDEMKTLYLMSQCSKGAVISNSTFSLWGVLLGAYHKNGVIIYPSSENFLKPLPRNWIKI